MVAPPVRSHGTLGGRQALAAHHREVDRYPAGPGLAGLGGMGGAVVGARPPRLPPRRGLRDQRHLRREGRTDAVNAARAPVAGLFLAIVGALTAWTAHRNVQQSRAALEATRIQHQEKLEADREAADKRLAQDRAAAEPGRICKAST